MQKVFLAGALGVEPSSVVLETIILPMYYAPKFLLRYLYYHIFLLYARLKENLI